MERKNKKVILVNSAVYLPGEGGYKRTVYLFDMMHKLGYDPILLTSDFNHYNKQTRNINEFKKVYPDYAESIEFIHVPAYKKNISLKRILSEKVWTKAIKDWFVKHKNEVDAVMLSMPDMNTILAIENICRKNNIEIIIDVRDLRPEAFRVLVKNDTLYKILLYPMKCKANRAYSCADKLFAVSKEYLLRGSSVNKRAKVRKTVYIGAALDRFDGGVEKHLDSIDKMDNDIWVTYVGTLGVSYDLMTLIDSARLLKQLGYSNIKIVILGQGPDAEALKQYASSIGADNVEFIGFVNYEKVAAYLKKSDMTVNAIKKRGSQSIINKVADYFAAGVPMLNGCTCKEQQQMVEDYEIGLNYEAENPMSLTEAIIKLRDNPNICKTYGLNARKLAEQQFNREHSYMEIINSIYD